MKCPEQDTLDLDVSTMLTKAALLDKGNYELFTGRFRKGGWQKIFTKLYFFITRGRV